MSLYAFTAGHTRNQRIALGLDSACFPDCFIFEITKQFGQNMILTLHTKLSKGLIFGSV